MNYSEKIQQSTCLFCGAPLENNKCNYCGTGLTFFKSDMNYDQLLNELKENYANMSNEIGIKLKPAMIAISNCFRNLK